MYKALTQMNAIYGTIRNQFTIEEQFEETNVDLAGLNYVEQMDNVDFQDLIDFGRYIQFMEMGFMEGDTLESSRSALDYISAGSARLNQINAQRAAIKIK